MNKDIATTQSEIIPPLTLETLHAYADEIFTPIKRGECVSTIWPPMAGRRIRNKFIISYPQIFESEIGKSDEYLLVYVEPLELTEESTTGYINLIIRSIQENYECLYHDDPIDQKDISSTSSYAQSLENLSVLIKRIAAKNLKIVLFLGEFDELAFADHLFYNNLKSLWSKTNQGLFFVFLLLNDVVKPEQIDKFGELNELVLRNVVYVPLLNEGDINYLIDYFSKQFNRSFSNEERRLLIDVCGGHPYLLKSGVRLISLLDDNKLNEKALKELLINHYEPRSAAVKIFNLLTSTEQNILRTVASSSLSQLPTGAEMLVKLGLIKKNERGVFVPFGELFKSVIEKDQQKAIEAVSSSGEFHFDEKSGAILIGNENIEEKFTRQEYEILSFFLKEPNKLRSRDEISEAMWGKEAYEKYSDWAIDQIMSKIRRKLHSLGAGKFLVTVRGRGYKLVKN